MVAGGKYRYFSQNLQTLTNFSFTSSLAGIKKHVFYWKKASNTAQVLVCLVFFLLFLEYFDWDTAWRPSTNLIMQFHYKKAIRVDSWTNYINCSLASFRFSKCFHFLSIAWAVTKQMDFSCSEPVVNFQSFFSFFLSKLSREGY